MKLEELIAALNQSNIEMNAQEEIVVMIKRCENTSSSEYFSVLETCKGDMKEEFEASPKMRLEIDQFTDEQMKELATDVGWQLQEYYWDALRQAVVVELERER